MKSCQPIGGSSKFLVVRRRAWWVGVLIGELASVPRLQLVVLREAGDHCTRPVYPSSPYLSDYKRRRSEVRVQSSFFSLISRSSLTRTSMGMTPRAADIRVRLDKLGTLFPFST